MLFLGLTILLLYSVQKLTNTLKRNYDPEMQTMFTQEINILKIILFAFAFTFVLRSIIDAIIGMGVFNRPNGD